MLHCEFWLNLHSLASELDPRENWPNTRRAILEEFSRHPTATQQLLLRDAETILIRLTELKVGMLEPHQ